MKNKLNWAEEYLTILGLDVEQPTENFLTQITQAHLTTFPFENISKLISFRDRSKNQFEIPSGATFIKNHQDYHFGGTCYTLNSNLKQLLESLGFECYFAMLGKEHMGIIVEVEGTRYYVDCGAAAPMFKPVPFERNPQNVSAFGEDKVFILPVHPAEGEYKYVRYTQGLQNGRDWEFNVQQKCQLGDFATIIQQANEPGTTFMTLLRCQLWQPNKQRSVSLVNHQFSIRYADGRIEKMTLASLEEIEYIIKKEFLLTKLPVREAICILEELDIDIFHQST